MSVEITYFVHGTTIDNETGKATGWLPGELSDLGIQQSKELGELVKDKKFDVVISSDLQRAIDSAKCAFEDKYEIIQDKRLREANYGDWNGGDEHFKNNLNKYISNAFPNGESYKQIENRIKDFLNYLKKEYDGKKVALVAHQAPQLAIEVLLNNKTWKQSIETDWRKVGQWQPGWKYKIK
ncbi:MAG: histidine phosphatase family protein [Candidatus Kerfeldbacteria bacterium]